MRQRKLLVLLVVAFAVFITDVTFATSTIERTASNLNVLNIDRNLKGNSEMAKAEGKPTDPKTEERGVNLPSFNGLKNIFSKSSKVGNAVKNNPEIATTLNNPQVRQVFNEVGKQPGLLQKLQNIPVLKTLASRLRRRSTQFTSRQITNVGHLAVTSSKSSVFSKLWVKFGSAALFALSIAFLVTMVLVAKS